MQYIRLGNSSTLDLGFETLLIESQYEIELEILAGIWKTLIGRIG